MGKIVLIRRRGMIACFFAIICFTHPLYAQNNVSVDSLTTTHSLGVFAELDFPISSNKTANFKKGNSFPFSVGIQKTIMLGNNNQLNLSVGYSRLSFRKDYYGNLNNVDMEYFGLSYQAIMGGLGMPIFRFFSGKLFLHANFWYAFDKKELFSGNDIPFASIDLTSYKSSQMIYMPNVGYQTTLFSNSGSELELHVGAGWFCNNSLFNFTEDNSEDFTSTANGLSLKLQLIWLFIN